MKVVAITVTFNRIHTLRRTIDALINQSCKVDKIIIVDNNSSLEMKEQLENLKMLSKDIDVLYLQDNLGGAGGFEAGMKKALNEYNPDWYWIMDDDAYPKKDCLEKLLNYEDKLNKIGCLCPVIYGIDNNEYQMYHHKNITKYTFKDQTIPYDYLTLPDVVKVEANAFVGPLFSKEVVENLGIADGGLFIYGDDTEYTYRVSREFNVYLIKNAVIEHQDPPISNNVLSPNSWWKEYYQIRNRFLFVKKFEKNAIKLTFSQMYLSCIVIKKIMASLLKDNYKGYVKFRVNLLLKAWRDGVIGKKGKTVDPIEYSRMISAIIIEEE